MAPMETEVRVWCPQCGAGYQGSDGRAAAEFTREHAPHGAHAQTTAQCSGCGASYQGTDQGALMEFMKEHAFHGTHCPNCGESLSLVDNEGTCPRCGKKVKMNLTITRTEKIERGRRLFGR